MTTMEAVIIIDEDGSPALLIKPGTCAEAITLNKFRVVDEHEEFVVGESQAWLEEWAGADYYRLVE